MNNQSHRAAIAAPFSAEAREQFQHVLTPAPGQTLASLATFNIVTGLWVVDPSVVGGALIDVSDASSIPAAALLAIAAVTGVQVTAANATEISGTVSEITDLRASATISTPSGAVTMLIDTVAHLGTLGNGWAINPLVFEGAYVTVTDSGEISSDFLVALLGAGNWDGQVDVPNATGFIGGYNNMANVYTAMDDGNIRIPAGLPVTVTDSLVDAYTLTRFAAHTGVVVRFDHVAELTGNLGTVVAVLSNPSVYQFADFALISLYSVSVAGLASARTQIAQYTDAAVTAPLLDSINNLLSQDLVTGVWSLKPGTEGATVFQIEYAPSLTVAAGALQALVDAVGAGHVYMGNVNGITGSLAEIKHLTSFDLSLSQYGFTLSDATVSAADLIALAARATFNVEATAATKLSGSLSELSSVFSDTTIVLSGTENISITSALTVAELAAQRTSLAVKTSGTVTGALADSIANLTGHTAEAGSNGYTVADTLLNLQAGGAIVDGAHGFTIIAGGPTSMSVADALALVVQLGDGALLDLTSVTSFTGSALQIKQMLDAGVKTGDFGVTLSDTTVTTAQLLEIGEIASGTVAASAVTSVSGAYEDLLTVLLGSHYVLSGTEAVSVTDGLTLDELATFKALAPTTGIVSAVLRGSVAELTGHTADGGGVGYIVRDSATVLLAGGALITGAQALELTFGGVPNTMTALDALRLVDLVGAGDPLNLSNVRLFTGSVSDVLRLYDANVSLFYFGVQLSDAVMTAEDLLQIARQAVYSVELTTASRVSGTLSEFKSLLNDGVSWSNASINVTSPVTVAALAEVRSHLGQYNVVTGALADSVAHLTGHLAEAGGNGYSVIDTVAHVLAGGVIVNGARVIQLADNLANLTGHTTAGGASAYSVIDTVANLSLSDGVVTGHAQAVILRDTIAHLTGHTDAGGATSYIVVDSLDHVLAAGVSGLVNAAAGVALTDLTIDAESIYDAWNSATLSREQQIDAAAAHSVSGGGYIVADVLSDHAVHFASDVAVTLYGNPDVYYANQIDAATTGVVTASLSATAQRLVTLTGTNNDYDLTVTDAVSVFQLKSLDAITTGTVSYGTVVDTAGNLAKLVNGAWVVDSQLHANTDIIVIGEIAAGALQALQMFNVDGEVTQATQAVNHFNIATSAVANYTIAAGEVTNLIDVAGNQTYHVAQSSGLTSGGVLNLSGVDGLNTIVFDGYYAGGGEGLLPRSYLTMTQSGTTAYFLDAQTHMQVAAISLNEDAGRQYIQYADGNVQELRLIGSIDPVIQLYWID